MSLENITDGSGRINNLLVLVGQPRVYVGVIITAILAGLPLVLSGYLMHVTILVFLFGGCGIAWNLVGGYGGMFALGNMVFFGIGGYVTGLLILGHQVGFFPSIAVALLLSLVAAYIIGAATFRLSGHYFALATLAIIEGAVDLVGYARDITGGWAGLSLFTAMTREPIFALERSEYFYLAFGFFVTAFIVVALVRYSKPGYYLMATRDDQMAAASLGIDVFRYKMFTWLITAFLTTIAGIIYTVYVQFLNPGTMFSLDLSVLFAVMVIIGGRATLSGPVIGAFLMIPLREIAINEFGGEIGAITYVVYGVVLIALITFAPEGIVNRLNFVGKRIERLLPRFGSSAERGLLPWK